MTDFVASDPDFQGQHVLFMEPVEMQKAQGFCIYLLAPGWLNRGSVLGLWLRW